MIVRIPAAMASRDLEWRQIARTGSAVRRLLVLMLLLLPVATRAEQFGLLPANSQVGFRAYGLGLLPFDGKFTRFHGWMRYEAANSTACQVILEIEAGSLAMSDNTVGEQITGPDFMDVARFPDLSFHGGCLGDTVSGSLTLHGETHPLILELERTTVGIVATGRLRRADWGITSHPLIGGSTIRIRVELPNPSVAPTPTSGPHI